AGTMRILKILVAVDPALPHGGTLRTAVQLATAAEAQIAVPWRDPQGVPAVEIVRAADRERADLIVLPRDPRNTLEGTVQRARVPCLVVAPGGAGLGRVLAAIDGGPDSGDVLGAARAIGQLPGSEVLSVRVERWSGCATASLASAGELSGRWGRSEEHMSELQSRFDLVCRLLLEKKSSWASCVWCLRGPVRLVC